MPLFSVIVPVYKVAEYLPQCIESILAQTFTDFELILVDDGSPDNCGRICDDYVTKDRRIRVLHKQNGGVTSARLVGAEIAIGTYLAYIDGDDWVSFDYLSSFAECIRKYDPDIICCGFLEKYEDKTIAHPCAVSAGYYDKEQIKQKIFPMLIEREDGIQFSNSICSKVFRRELYLSQQKKVDKRIKVGEDMAVTKPCIYRANDICVISNCLYYYRQNPASVMRSRRPVDMDDPMRIGKHLESHIDMMDADFRAQVYRSVVHSLFYAAMTQFNRKENYNTITEQIKQYLQDPYYKNAIENCRFRGNWKCVLAKLVLKYRICCLIWIYSRVK